MSHHFSCLFKDHVLFLITMVMGTGSVERFFSFAKYTDTDQRHGLHDNGRCLAFMTHYIWLFGGTLGLSRIIIKRNVDHQLNLQSPKVLCVACALQGLQSQDPTSRLNYLQPNRIFLVTYLRTFSRIFPAYFRIIFMAPAPHKPLPPQEEYYFRVLLCHSKRRLWHCH